MHLPNQCQLQLQAENCKFHMRLELTPFEKQGPNMWPDYKARDRRNGKNWTQNLPIEERVVDSHDRFDIARGACLAKTEHGASFLKQAIQGNSHYMVEIESQASVYGHLTEGELTSSCRWICTDWEISLPASVHDRTICFGFLKRHPLVFPSKPWAAAFPSCTEHTGCMYIFHSKTMEVYIKFAKKGSIHKSKKSIYSTYLESIFFLNFHRGREWIPPPEFVFSCL
jgi:hypothetical protein